MFRWPLARFLVAACAALLVTACGEEEPRGPLVLAASSVQEALEEAADAWQGQGNPRPVLTFAGTSALARQIEQGAPADLFLSADEEWMDTLEQAGALRPGTRRDLLGNRIVLVAPQGAAPAVDIANAGSLAAALGDGRLAMADPEAVPAGKYGKAALESLGLWPVVAQRVAPAENVRAALALVEAGEAPLGLVYATDAAASSRIRVVVRFPAASHPPIRYPIALLAASTHPDAERFADFLASPEARAIFVAHGFTAR